MILRSLLIFALALCSGCAAPVSPYTKSGIAGGLIGGGLGAGTGAAVGSLISNGSVTQSALLGGAIGVPAGIIAGVSYRSYMEKRELRRNEKKISDNYEYIKTRQQEIDRTREDLIDESFAVLPDEELKEDLYDGPTIGTYR